MKDEREMERDRLRRWRDGWLAHGVDVGHSPTGSHEMLDTGAVRAALGLGLDTAVWEAVGRRLSPARTMHPGREYAIALPYCQDDGDGVLPAANCATLDESDIGGDWRTDGVVRLTSGDGEVIPPGAWREVREVMDALTAYPILCEETHARHEVEDQAEQWEDWGREEWAAGWVLPWPDPDYPREGPELLTDAADDLVDSIAHRVWDAAGLWPEGSGQGVYFPARYAARSGVGVLRGERVALHLVSPDAYPGLRGRDRRIWHVCALVADKTDEYGVRVEWDAMTVEGAAHVLELWAIRGDDVPPEPCSRTLSLPHVE